MIRPKNREEIDSLREGGRRLALILAELSGSVAPGLSTDQIDEHARRLCQEHEVTPAFLDYQPHGAPRPFPAALCVSINDAIVHGIPNETPRTLKEGDIVTLDMGVVYNNLITDSAVTVGVGEISDHARDLLQVTQTALNVGIQAAQSGVRTGDIGSAIETYVRPHGYAITRGLAGHGVGYSVHEDPFVPNTGTPDTGEKLPVGVVIAIEPMLALGSADITTGTDGFTIFTADGSLSAHFEHTLAITEDGPMILTTQ